MNPQQGLNMCLPVLASADLAVRECTRDVAVRDVNLPKLLAWLMPQKKREWLALVMRRMQPQVPRKCRDSVPCLPSGWEHASTPSRPYTATLPSRVPTCTRAQTPAL